MKRGPQQVDAALGLSPVMREEGRPLWGLLGTLHGEDSVQGHLCPGPSSFYRDSVMVALPSSCILR